MLIASPLPGKKMMASPDQIADYFIAFANATGSLITNPKLQKLVFYTQAWHIAVFKKPVFEDDFQAWIHGPVLPALYEQYRSFQWRPIDRQDLTETTLQKLQKDFEGSLGDILSDVVEEYFSQDAYALEKSTHAEFPWLKARRGLASDDPSTNIIEKEDLFEFYSQYVKK